MGYRRAITLYFLCRLATQDKYRRYRYSNHEEMIKIAQRNPALHPHAHKSECSRTNDTPAAPKNRGGGCEMPVDGLHLDQWPLATCIGFWILIEGVFTTRSTEVIGFILVFRCPFGSFWIYFHLANRVSFHGFSLGIKQV